MVKIKFSIYTIFLRTILVLGLAPLEQGKPFLAVAAAVEALERQEIRRILLTRPAVEAGEKLGSCRVI